MSIRELGGPAFPLHPNLPPALGCGRSETDAGMTLLDYFAAKALQGMLAYGMPDHEDWTSFAQYAYAQAEAMLRARADRADRTF